MRQFFFRISIIMLFGGCVNKKIEITNEYIINEYWSKKNDISGGNSIKINKMTIKKDSVFNPYSDLGNEEVLDKLQEDSLFEWYANVKTEERTYKNQKIYFNKDNGFTWLDNVTKERTRIFGNLEKGNWYKFSILKTSHHYVYIYIDSLKMAHRFDIDLSNY